MNRPDSSRILEPERGSPVTGVPPACCSLDIDGRDEDRLIGMFRGLSNPIRFEILQFLLTHPGCITGSIVDHLPRSQATVSQHLKVLRDTGWVDGTIEGPATSYGLHERNIAWFRTKVGEIF